MRGIAGVRRDLAACMHTRVRPSGDRQLSWLLAHSGQGALELALDGAQPRLRRPAGEVGPVVFEKYPAGQTSSRKTISDASERRGPSLRMRVYPPWRSA